MQTTYLIAAGGTAGHVVPALAVADALRTSGARVVFIGGDRAEAEMVLRAGFEFHRIPVEGLDRSNPLRAIRAVAKSTAATFTAWKMIGQLRPAAVLGGGGYVACSPADAHGCPFHRPRAPCDQRPRPRTPTRPSCLVHRQSTRGAEPRHPQRCSVAVPRQCRCRWPPVRGG